MGPTHPFPTPFNAPPIVPTPIERTNVLDAIDTILDSETSLVLLEGPDGIGKSVTTAQYYERHRACAAAVFLRASCKWGYDPSCVVYDLCNQLSFFLYQKELSDIEDASTALLRKFLMVVAKRSHFANTPFLVIVDGIDEIPHDDSSILLNIFELLPVGIPGFKLVVTGPQEAVEPFLKANVKIKSFYLPGFTLGESEAFLADVVDSKKAVFELYSTCKGNPGHLATVKRVIAGGVPADQLVEDLPRSLPDLFSYEWSKVDGDDQSLLLALALMAFDDKRHTVTSLASSLAIDPIALESKLRHLSFLQIACPDEVSYISNGFRKYSASQLSHLRNQVFDIQIKWLTEAAQSELALRELPAYYARTERFDDMIRYLSIDNMLQLMRQTNTLRHVKQHAAYGLSSASKLNRDVDLLCFAFQCSAIEALNSTQIWKSELEALLALQNTEAALTLAQCANLIEDRFHAYVIIAKDQRIRQLSPNQDIINQIEALYSQIDPVALGERAMEIAADLIFVSPEMAADLLKGSLNVEDDPNAVDIAFAKLTISAFSSQHLNTTAAAGAYDKATNNISNPSLKGLSSGLGILFKSCTAKEAISQVECLSDTSLKLFLLSQWAKVNKRKPDAILITDYGIKLAIRTTDYSPNARTIRELATPIAYTPKPDALASVMSLIESQLGTLEGIGPTEEYFRLLIVLAVAEAKTDKHAAYGRLVNTYLQLSAISDAFIRLKIFARLLSALVQMDVPPEVERKEGLADILRAELQASIDSILNTSADHCRALEGFFRAITAIDLDYALRVASEINTEARRDKAHATIARILLAVGNPIEQDKLCDVYTCVCDAATREELLLTILQHFGQLDVPITVTAKMQLVFEQVSACSNAARKCMGYCHRISIHNREVPADTSIIEQLVDKLSQCWIGMDSGWEKVDVGFNVVRHLADESKSIAEQFLKTTEQERENLTIDSYPIANTYISAVLLTIRAYGGLLPRHVDTVEDYLKIARLIEAIPSLDVQADMWDEIAVKAHYAHRSDILTKVMDDHLHPISKATAPEDLALRNEITVKAAPALYYSHQRSAMAACKALPVAQTEAAVNRIIRCVLSKQPPCDPVKIEHLVPTTISYNDLTDVLELLDMVDNDSDLYNWLETVVDIVESNRHRFSAQQRAECGRLVQEIANKKFPCPRGIRHDGYKILGSAQASRLLDPKDGAKWAEYVSAAKSLTNQADRAFVLSALLGMMPPSIRDRNAALRNEISIIIESLPIANERVDHYYFLASSIWKSSPQDARDILETAMRTCIGGDGFEFFEAHRRIIDLTYNFDPDLAASFASLTDTDMSRAHVREDVKRRLQIHDLKKRMSSGTGDRDSADRAKVSLPSASWMMLEALNSNQVVHLHVEKTRDYIRAASEMPLKDAYPVLSWVVENDVRRLRDTDQAITFLKPLFSGMLSATEALRQMTAYASVKKNKQKQQFEATDTEDSVVVGAGDRETAIRIIGEWIKNECSDALIVCDPYFSATDLEFLKLVLAANPGLHVRILAGAKANVKRNGLSVEDHYRSEWRRISAQDPPDTDITIVGRQDTGDSPIHDRWWITKTGGLRIGTSYNSIGTLKTSEISKMTLEEAQKCEEEVTRYLSRQERHVHGKLLRYMSFSL